MHPSLTHPLAPPDRNTVAGKVLGLLDAFGPEQPEYSLAELALRARLPKSTTHRVLAVLQAWGGVERGETGRYRLGSKIFELGGRVHDRLRLRELALPYMEDVLTATQETVHLAKLVDTDVLYIERLVSHRSVPTPSRVAGRTPASCTGLGKAILAFSPPEVTSAVISAGLRAMTAYSIADPAVFLDALDRIRREGVAFDLEEASAGLGCVAAPVFDRWGNPVAAMSVTAPIQRTNLDALVPAVKASTLAVSRRLGYEPALGPRLIRPLNSKG